MYISNKRNHCVKYCEVYIQPHRFSISTSLNNERLRLKRAVLRYHLHYDPKNLKHAKIAGVLKDNGTCIVLSESFMHRKVRQH